MIGWLQGKIVDKFSPNKMVIDVRGVGYDVEMSAQSFFCLEHSSDEISLFIHTVVREDAILLFGFANKDERTLFRMLIKVNGVGPKVALGILSSVSAGEFIHAIQQQNKSLLVNLPGIGKKTAERLIIEMKDSFNDFLTESDVLSSASPAALNPQNEAIHALEALGYKRQDAVKVVKTIDDGQKSCEQIIRQALQMLSSRVC